jgi:hypothetical protein
MDLIHCVAGWFQLILIIDTSYTMASTATKTMRERVGLPPRPDPPVATAIETRRDERGTDWIVQERDKIRDNDVCGRRMFDIIAAVYGIFCSIDHEWKDAHWKCKTSERVSSIQIKLQCIISHFNKIPATKRKQFLISMLSEERRTGGLSDYIVSQLNIYGDYTREGLMSCVRARRQADEETKKLRRSQRMEVSRLWGQLEVMLK